MKETKVVTKIVRVIGEVLLVYGLLGWTYGSLVQFIHPEWLPKLSHLTGPIRVDTYAIVSLILSITGFFVWRLTKELNRTPKNTFPKKRKCTLLR